MARPSKTGRRRVRFEFNAEPGSEVFVAGSFNDWNAAATPLKDNAEAGRFQRTMLLQPGHYEYKFVVNGIWCVDPQCEDWRANELGSLNSVLVVQ